MNNWFMNDLCKEIKQVVFEKQKIFNCLIFLADENDSVYISVFFLNDNSSIGWTKITDSTNKYDICIAIRRFFKGL